MRVAVVGNKGMLARDLILRLQESNIPFWGADLPELNITKPDEVRQSLEASGATVVVNCAAYTAVDKAESEPDLAFTVNRDGVRNLAMTCKRLDIPLIHLSTDYIFDGSLRRPYREEDEPRPLGVYGESKWAGERALQADLDKHVIVRTSWLFGALGQSFVKTILRLAREREILSIVDDQFGCPTWTGDLAEVLTRIVCHIAPASKENGLWGTYHYCGLEKTTWYGFAAEIVEQAKALTPLKTECVTPIRTEDFPTAAPRPQWSVLDCTKIERNFGLTQKSWKDGLGLVIPRLVKELVP